MVSIIAFCALNVSRFNSWYSARKFRPVDIIFMAVSLLLVAASLLLTYFTGSRYFNPFI